MKDNDINEVLSAYLDGESDNPEAVERLLENQPDLRRRLEILKSQSDALRALTPPDVSPAFTARVLDGVREERLKRHRGWMPLVLPLAAVAAVVVVLGAVYFATQPSRQSGRQPIANDIRTLREMDSQTLDAVLLEQLAAHPSAMDEWETAYDGVLDDPWDMATLLALDEMAEIMCENVDLEVLIDELNPDEKAVFRELLIQYAMEG